MVRALIGRMSSLLVVPPTAENPVAVALLLMKAMSEDPLEFGPASAEDADADAEVEVGVGDETLSSNQALMAPLSDRCLESAFTLKHSRELRWTV